MQWSRQRVLDLERAYEIFARGHVAKAAKSFESIIHYARLQGDTQTVLWAYRGLIQCLDGEAEAAAKHRQLEEGTRRYGKAYREIKERFAAARCMMRENPGAEAFPAFRRLLEQCRGFLGLWNDETMLAREYLASLLSRLEKPRLIAAVFSDLDAPMNLDANRTLYVYLWTRYRRCIWAPPCDIHDELQHVICTAGNVFGERTGIIGVARLMQAHFIQEHGHPAWAENIYQELIEKNPDELGLETAVTARLRLAGMLQHVGAIGRAAALCEDTITIAQRLCAPRNYYVSRLMTEAREILGSSRSIRRRLILLPPVE